MNQYLQYHNVDVRKLPLSDPPFSKTYLGIRTRRPNVKNADGRVFLIAGIGRPRRFFLWETFEIEEIKRKGEEFVAMGTGWQLAPPRELTGPAFDSFKRSCANFVGFRRIDDLPFTKTLNRLALADHLAEGVVDQVVLDRSRVIHPVANRAQVVGERPQERAGSHVLVGQNLIDGGTVQVAVAERAAAEFQRDVIAVVDEVRRRGRRERRAAGGVLLNWDRRWRWATR